MERNMKVTVRLSELELVKLDVLCAGGSRDAYFRNVLKPLAEQEVALCEASLNGLRIAAKDAFIQGKGAEEYRRRIAQYESDLVILRGVEH